MENIENLLYWLPAVVISAIYGHLLFKIKILSERISRLENCLENCLEKIQSGVFCQFEANIRRIECVLREINNRCEANHVKNE